MNNAFIVNRTKTTGAMASQLIIQNQTKSNPDMINAFYLNILSRYPTPEELAKINIPASGATRTTAIADLVWSLYNKVDFIFNY